MQSGEFRGAELSLADLATADDGRAVLAKMTVHSITDIDQVGGTFSTDLTFHMWWLEPGLKSRWASLEADVVNISAEDCLVPKFHFENCVVMVPDGSRSAIIELRKASPAGVVHWERRMRFVLTEAYELAEFPFDVQVLSIPVRLNSKADDARRRHFAFIDYDRKVDISRVDLIEWHIYEACGQVGHDRKGKALFHAHVVLRRKHFYYSFNVICMMGALTSLGFTTAAQEADACAAAARPLTRLDCRLAAFPPPPALSTRTLSHAPASPSAARSR